MNIRQAIALVIGIAIACLVLAFPPYWNDSGLIGGDYFAFFHRLPPHDYPWQFDTYCLVTELIVVGVTTFLALITFRSSANRSHAIVGTVGLAITVLSAVFLADVGRNGLPGAAFFWRMIGIVPAITLGVVFILAIVSWCRRRKKSNPPRPATPA